MGRGPPDSSFAWFLTGPVVPVANWWCTPQVLLLGPGAGGGGAEVAPATPVRAVAPCMNQPFSVVLSNFGTGHVCSSLQGLVHFFFLRLISSGSWALIFVLIACREVVESVSQLDLSLSS